MRNSRVKGGPGCRFTVASGSDREVVAGSLRRSRVAFRPRRSTVGWCAPARRVSRSATQGRALRSVRAGRTARMLSAADHDRVCAVRQRTGWGPRLIACEVGLPHATVRRALRRRGCSRRPRRPREPVRRYEWPCPGNLLGGNRIAPTSEPIPRPRPPPPRPQRVSRSGRSERRFQWSSSAAADGPQAVRRSYLWAGAVLIAVWSGRSGVDMSRRRPCLIARLASGVNRRDVGARSLAGAPTSSGN